MKTNRKIYKQGIYDISNEEYHSSAGISRSGIMQFKKSPKHYWYRYLNTAYQRKEMSGVHVFGNAVHCLLIEPENFENQFIIKPELNERIGKLPLLKDVGRESYELAKKEQENKRKLKSQLEEKFELESDGKMILNECDFKNISIIKKTIFSDTQCNQLISGAEYEKSIYWIDSDTGMLCKCRPDIWNNNFIVDLKTTADASEREFQRSFYKYGYHIQVGMIAEGIKAVSGIEMKNFIDLAIEKEEPYCHAIYPIDESSIQHGIDEFKHYLFKLKECFEKNEWKGYPTKTLSLPNYATIGE